MGSMLSSRVAWEDVTSNNFVYRGKGFTVTLSRYPSTWTAIEGGKVRLSRAVPTFESARRAAELWILEREGRLCEIEIDGWISASRQKPQENQRVEVITECTYVGNGWWGDRGEIMYWRSPRGDPHAVAACLFVDQPITAAQAFAATQHVVECAECQARLKEKSASDPPPRG